MATTQGAVTELSPEKSTFMSCAMAEPELDSINFTESLKFFQEQLSINGRFPSPSASTLTHNDIRSKISLSNETSKYDSFKSNKNALYEDGPKSLNSCHISIPTVDTILESVRVLRAIQKSQEQRGSTWSLDGDMSDPNPNIHNLPHLLNLVQTSLQRDFTLLECDISELPEPKENQAITANGGLHNGDCVSEHKCPQNLNPNGSNKTACIPNVNNGMTMNPDQIVPRGGVLVESKPVGVPINDSDLDTQTTKEVSVVNNGNTFWPNNTILEGTHNSSSGIGLKQDMESKNETAEHKSSTNSFVSSDFQQDNNLNWKSFKNGSDNIFSGTKESTKDDSEIFDIAESEMHIRGDFSELNKHSAKNLVSTDTNSLFEKCPNEVHRNYPEGEIRLTQSDEKTGTDCNLTDTSKDTQKEVEIKNSPQELKIEISTPTIQFPTLRPDSVSDSCSSQYVSAECSPCSSFTFVSESPTRSLLNHPDQSTGCTDEECKNEGSFTDWTFTEACIEGTNDDSRTCHETSSTLSSTSIFSNTSENHLPNDPLEVTSALCTESENILNDANEDIGIISVDTTDSSDVDQKLNQSDNLSFGNISSQNCNIVELTKESCDDTINESITEKSTPQTKESIAQINETDKTNESITSDSCNLPNKIESNESSEDSSVLQVIAEETFKSVSSLTSENTESPNLNKNSKSKDSDSIHDVKKYTTSSWNLIDIVETLYRILETQQLQATAEDFSFERKQFLTSQGAMCQFKDGFYTVKIQQSTLEVSEESKILFRVPLQYLELSIMNENTLKVDNKLGRCIFLRCESQELLELKEAFEKYYLIRRAREPIKLVNYPLKCHRNVIIIDLGSCSTRAGILMDQPTLPFLFFPSVCATDKVTGVHIYGKEALHPEVRQNSHLSFPVRPSIQIIKHSIDINLVGGIFKKIFQELRVDPAEYAVQVCLPRTLSINAQDSLLKLLLEKHKVQSVSLTHQALLTLYAHNVSTGIVVDVGDRMDILPVVDGFIVENGVTRLPFGGQRLIHHMKHALAEKHISLSNDIDAFVVQYITENLTYIAEDYEDEIKMATKFPEVLRKSIELHPFAKDDNCAQFAVLDDARFKIPEGLFKPNLWGLDSPGIHRLVQNAIQSTGVDVRKKISENIFVSGGVTLIPGFAERLNKEVSHLNPRIASKVIASSYRYHCTYIGACKFASMDVFPKVCVNIEEYEKNQILSLKKFVLCF